MRPMLPLAAAAAVVFAAAAAPVDPTLAQLEAGARAVPVKVARPFERTQRIEGGKTKRVYVDRYDPQLPDPWKLVSVDGRAPKADELKDWRGTTKNGLPSYNRVALLLQGAQRVDATHYRLERLPKGFLKPEAIAAHVSAELTVDTSGPKPFVRESRFFAKSPFRVMVIAKVDRFEATNRYALGRDGVPHVTEQVSLIAGSGPGMSGEQTRRVTYSPLG